MSATPLSWPLTWRAWSALAIIAVLSTAATSGLHSITDDWTFLLPAAIGSVTSIAAFVVASRWRMLPGETLAVALGMFVAMGIVVVSVVAAGDIPSPASAGDFFDGLVRSWADLLSAVSPAELTPRLSVAPYATAWFGALVGCAVLRWSPVPSASVLGPLVALSVMVLLTDEARTLSLIVGAAIAVGALTLGLLFDPRRSGSTSDHPNAGEGATETTMAVGRHARTWRAAVVLVAVAALAPLVGPRLPLADAHERYDLRDQVVPPWNPLSVPSPLVQLKGSLAAEREDDVVFEVALPADTDAAPTRWTSAVMTSYDGIVWAVADVDDAATDFRPVGPRLPTSGVQPTTDPTTTATVTIGSLDGPWLPVPGIARGLEFDGSTSNDDAGSAAPIVMENQETGTLGVPSGLTEGLTYTVTALVPPTPADEALRGAELDTVEAGVDLEALPPQIRNLAADVTEGIDHGWGQVAAIRDLFRSKGFYDKSVLVPPGHSYYRLAQFLSEPEQIIGYEEQYAAAAALVARIAELPVRVAVGFEIEPDRYVDGVAEVRSGDAAAWIEVRVDDVGWVPVSVSPPRSREPQTETAVASQDQVATPNPPPPPQIPPDVDVFTDNEELEEPVEDEEDEEEEQDEPSSGGGIGILGWTLVGTGSVLVLIAAVCGGIVWWKRRRTNRRRRAEDPAARIAGAWFELTDRYQEAGIAAPPRSTPLESVRAMAVADESAARAEPQLVGLARHVDRAAFDSVPPPPSDADAAWRYSDEAVDALLVDASLPRRTRMRVDPRPLMRRDPVIDSTGSKESP